MINQKDDTVKVAKGIKSKEIFINKENFYIIELPKT